MSTTTKSVVVKNGIKKFLLSLSSVIFLQLQAQTDDMHFDDQTSDSTMTLKEKNRTIKTGYPKPLKPVDWRDITSVEDVCNAFPEKVEALFKALNLDYEGLEDVKRAYNAGNLPEAGRLLLDYYGRKERILPAEKLPTPTDETVADAETIMRDTFTIQGVTGLMPRLPDGRINWEYRGPQNDDEFAWLTNRHPMLGTLSAAYFRTGNTKYVRHIDYLLKDWIISSLPYPAAKSSTGMWRGLEVHSREKSWVSVFYNLWNTNLISPATRLLMLASLVDHAHYARNFHACCGNWLTMEMSGLATVCIAWPEFREAPDWLQYTVNAMTASMKEQIYPDGVQTELTSHYHEVTEANFSQFAELCKQANIQLPDYYYNTIRLMWKYLAWTLRPDGYALLNNDSDLNYNRNILLRKAQELSEPEWAYIASNGAQGAKPEGEPSIVFPWAGQLISRSGYDTDAQWSFFDMGPWGSGHQHNDKLHLSVYAYGRDLLVDAGRFAYSGDVSRKFRRYALGSQGHNLVLVDGKGQENGVPVAKEPVNQDYYAITDDYDYGSGSFEKFKDTEGKFVHTRAMMYVRGRFWLVADRLETDRPRTIETLWHWHPDCKVRLLDNGAADSGNERGNLMVIPVSGNGKDNTKSWSSQLIKGQEDPIQGWYSRTYNEYEPNVTSVFSRQLPATETFVWLLLPYESKQPDIQAKIISKDANSVTVGITEKGIASWKIRIPFLDKTKIKYEQTTKSLK